MAFKMKGPLFFKESVQGYKKGSPDINEPKLKIKGNEDGTNITMDGVEFDVHGKDNEGNEKIMKPGKNYTFPGDYVIETPLKHMGYHGSDLDEEEHYKLTSDENAGNDDNWKTRWKEAVVTWKEGGKKGKKPKKVDFRPKKNVEVKKDNVDCSSGQCVTLSDDAAKKRGDKIRAWETWKKENPEMYDAYITEWKNKYGEKHTDQTVDFNLSMNYKKFEKRYEAGQTESQNVGRLKLPYGSDSHYIYPSKEGDVRAWPGYGTEDQEEIPQYENKSIAEEIYVSEEDWEKHGFGKGTGRLAHYVAPKKGEGRGKIYYKTTEKPWEGVPYKLPEYEEIPEKTKGHERFHHWQEMDLGKGGLGKKFFHFAEQYVLDYIKNNKFGVNKDQDFADLKPSVQKKLWNSIANQYARGSAKYYDEGSIEHEATKRKRDFPKVVTDIKDAYTRYGVPGGKIGPPRAPDDPLRPKRTYTNKLLNRQKGYGGAEHEIGPKNKIIIK